MATKLVWTSDPVEAKRLRAAGGITPQKEVEPGRQLLRIVADRKRRAGKTVTVVSGFQESRETLARVAASLKKACGSGGTVKESEIELQGDHVVKVAAELQKLGYRTK